MEESAGKRRLLVIGLDCAEPSLVFERWRRDLPTLDRLMRQGAYGRLQSSHPPITVPAWASMLSGRDPGELGIYGFRNRSDYSYGRMVIANGAAIRVPRVWDILGEAGKDSIVVGVPQTYPVRPLRGHLISCFLTPPGAREWTYPASLAGEVGSLLGGAAYEFDVGEFRTTDRERLLRSIYEMTRKRWQVVRHLAREKDWDFLMAVEMGTDRIHHGFWSAMDPKHHRHEPGNPFESAIHDYYVHLDGEIGRLLETVGDETIVVVVSDHGAKRMDGGFCLNEWLRRTGYLSLRAQPLGIATLEECQVDWSRTLAWGSGGYYGRIFLNVAGREPAGIIPPAEYETVRRRLKAELEATVGPDGEHLGTVALIPEETYREVNGIPPDLIVYFGNLSWRSVGTLGHTGLHTLDNDTGPDDANHAQHGILIVSDPLAPLGGEELTGLQIEQVAPTLLALLGVAPPKMSARAITLRWPAGANGHSGSLGDRPAADSVDRRGYTSDEELVVSDRLAALGYL